MQVVDNKAGGQLYMGANQAAVELKRGINPLNVSMLIQAEPESGQPGCGRYSTEWFATELHDEVEPAKGRAAADAYCVATWNLDSMAANAGAAECPDLYDMQSSSDDDASLAGHICRALQALSQGLTVMIQGTSAGSPTYISHGRLVSLFISPRF